MINFKNIVKVLLIALFVCAYSGDVWAVLDTNNNNMKQQNIPPVDSSLDGGKQMPTTKTEEKKEESQVVTSGTGGGNDASFCGTDLGVFKELVQTGQMIFNRLRDLIYVVAGFGIIAVAVGGFFGNLNWKWLGAIVISLVVIATAGELIVLLTGCEQFSDSLITNTLTQPTVTMSTEDYNKAYTENVHSSGRIQWNDMLDEDDYYAGSTHDTASSEAPDFQ